MSLASLFEGAVGNHRAGLLDAAERQYREVLEIAPDHAGALSNLGRIARAKGDLKAAIDLYRKAAANAAAPAEVHFNLGNALRDAGDLEAAVDSYETALRAKPDFGAAIDALARLKAEGSDPDRLTREANDLFLKGEGDQAEALLRRVAALRPEDPAALQNLAFLYRSTGHYHKAIGVYRRAAAMTDAPIIRVEIANCLVNTGAPLDARLELEALLATPQGRRAASSSYLMSLLYDPAASPAFIRDEHRRLTADWPALPPARRRRARKRALRVGYLTADFFGRHPVSQFLSPVIKAHRDPAFGIESFAYDAKPRIDATASEMSSLVPVRSIEGMSDDAAAEIIRQDDLDLLVDLSGHTSGRRLPVLGLRPAPATACFIGYPSTTGYSGVDWLIGDHATFPEGSDDLYTERLARLPRTWLAFAPPPDMPQPLPQRRDGPVTFGSLNHFPKINDRVIDVWARILRATPAARLMMQCAAFAEPQSADGVRAAFQARGVESARLDLRPPQPFAEAMRRYNEIDIALDPFPYNGGTTTAHALYMGAPVVSLEGRYFCGRMGASLLAAAGRREWLARDEDHYVAIASDLASRIDAGANSRGDLHAANAAAPLLDIAAYARDVADAYRMMAGRA